MSIESVMPSNHLVLCRPLFLLPSIFPSIILFSNELALRIRWPKYWSFSISPSDECLQLVSSRIDWFDLLVLSDQIRSVAQSCLTLCDPINNYKNHKMCSCVPRVCKGSLSLVVKLITQKDLKLKRENCSWKSVKEDKFPCTWTKSLMMGSIMKWGFEGGESTVRWTMKWSVKLVVQTMRRHDMAGTVLSLFSLL